MYCSEITQVQSFTDDKNKVNGIAPFTYARGRSEKAEYKISRKNCYKEKSIK